MKGSKPKKARKRKAHGHVRQSFYESRRFWMLGSVALVGVLGLAVIGHRVVAQWPQIVASTEEFVARQIDARVKTVMVSGVVYAQAPLLKKALGLEEGHSLVGFDARAARQRLEALDWVRSARVVRVLPSTVKVDIQEYKPLARLDESGEIWVMAQEGHLITRQSSGFDKLPILRGKGAKTKAKALFGKLAEHSGMSEKVSGGIYVGERRWDIEFFAGGTVRLPENGIEKALGYLSLLHETRQILEVPDVVIDLRIEGRIVLQLPEDVNNKFL